MTKKMSKKVRERKNKQINDAVFDGEISSNVYILLIFFMRFSIFLLENFLWVKSDNFERCATDSIIRSFNKPFSLAKLSLSEQTGSGLKV